MDKGTKDFLYKVLLWGGGGLLALLALRVVTNVAWGLISSPIGLLLVGGGGYYAYRKFKKSREEEEKIENFEDFDDFDEIDRDF